MLSPEKKYSVGLSFFEGIGPLRFNVLKKYFGSAEKIYKASKEKLLETGLGDKLINNFCEFRQRFNLDQYVKAFLEKGITVITLEDKIYPPLLRQINSAPFIIYCLGDSSLLADELKIAVVGTRKPTIYGSQITKKLVGDLAQANITIISGMAMGIDAFAHKAALEHNGRTVAVLGCGVDICYPAVNRLIYQEIIKKGLIISEFPPGKRSSIGVFPSRNRIIVGLSLGVLVIEGSEKSGTLITARYAAEFGRDVFACPGPITSEMSQATTYLLKNGAKVVASSSDVLEEYRIKHREIKSKEMVSKLSNLSEEEKKIVDLAKNHGEIHIDTIVQYLQIESSKVFSLVSVMEINGILKRVDNEKYILNLD